MKTALHDQMTRKKRSEHHDYFLAQKNNLLPFKSYCLWITGWLLLLCSPYVSVAQGNYNQSLSKTKVYGNKTATANARLVGDKVMIFEANALYNAKASSYIAIFNMTQLGKTAQDASQLMSNRFGNFVKGLSAIGITPGQLFLDMVSMSPIFEYEEEKKLFSKTFTEVPKSVELKKNIHVHYKNAKLLDRIVEIATQNEIYDLIKIDYFVEKTETIYDQLRERSVAYLNKKLASFRKLGIKLDTNYRVIAENSSVSSPIENYASYFVLSSTPHHISKRNKANVRQLRKPSTRFYNQIPYKKFDIIINPVVTEPVVQYSYNLKIKYLIRESPKDKKKVVKKYYLVTPDGTVKTLNVDD